MNVSLFKACQVLGIPPSLWVVPNPLKIYEFLEVVSASGLKREHSILDFGCGKGHWTLSLARRCHIAIGVDISESRIAIARRFARHSSVKDRVEFLCSPLEKADLPPHSFDRIFSFCVLEHIQNLDKVLHQVFRLLRPGGELHVSVDSLALIKDHVLIENHRRTHGVVQYFIPSLLRQYIEAAGLQVTEILPILTTEFARQEFQKRILKTYKYGPVKVMRIYRRLRNEDQRSNGSDGIMLVGRARRPAPEDVSVNCGE